MIGGCDRILLRSERDTAKAKRGDMVVRRTEPLQGHLVLVVSKYGAILWPLLQERLACGFRYLQPAEFVFQTLTRARGSCSPSMT